MAKKRKKNGAVSESSGGASSAAGSAPPAAANRAVGANGGGERFYYFPAERRPFSLEALTDAARRPPQIVRREWRREIPHMLAVFAFAFGLYAWTAPRFVCLEDDGLFLMNMHLFGVAHPPGYPLHTMLGGIFFNAWAGLHGLLFSGAPPYAYIGHMFSGFAGAIACAAIYATVAMLTRGRVFGYAGGAAYAASKTFWSQSIIAEVYALNAMMFFIVLALCLAYAAHAGARRDSRHFALYCAIAFIYGLGLSNHWPLLGLGGVGLGILVLSQLGSIVRRLPAGLLCLALGLLPYAWLVLRSHSDTIANFYGPIETLDQFGFYAFRKGYVGVDNQENVGLDDKLAFAWFLTREMIWQFTPAGGFFAVVGFIALARSRFNWVWLALAAAWFMSGFLLVIMIDFKAEFIWFSAFRVYPLVAYGVMAIWLAVGMAKCADWLRLKEEARAPLAGGAAAALVLASAVVHWDQNNRRDYRWAHDFASFKLASLEPDADLFTFDDLDVPVGYLHFVERVRPDLTVYNDQGLVFGNRLYSPLLPDSRKVGVLRAHIESTDRPIYYHPLRLSLFAGERYGSDFLGFLRRVNREGPEDRVILGDSLRRWLDNNLDPNLRFTDQWTRHQHFNTVATLVNAIITASLHGFRLDDQWREVIDRAKERNILARIIANTQLLSAGRLSPEEIAREWEWSQTVRREDHPNLDFRGFGHFYHLRAHLAAARDPRPDNPEYLANLLQSLEVFDENTNPALRALLNFYYGNNRIDELLEVTDKYYPKAEDIPRDILRLIRHARRRRGG